MLKGSLKRVSNETQEPAVCIFIFLNAYSTLDARLGGKNDKDYSIFAFFFLNKEYLSNLDLRAESARADGSMGTRSRSVPGLDTKVGAIITI